MNDKTVYDIIGIGIGPFNLGLAALADSISDLKCLFVDQRKEFNWHPGLLLDNARLQVPFYADLVTLANPCSKYSYLSFLKAKKRMFRFAILENNFILRKEYNDYCQWVAHQLENLFFSFRCDAIHFDETEKIYIVYLKDIRNNSIIVLQSKHVVIGVGTMPYVPECARSAQTSPVTTPGLKATPASGGQATPIEGDKEPLVFHSSDYLYFKERLLTKKSVTVIGSGQSAAEIFNDLLASPPAPSPEGEGERNLNWFTRSEHFFPMDYSKFALEKTSPDYIDYFFQLSPKKKKSILLQQNHLYMGINASLIDEIYQSLYYKDLFEVGKGPGLYPNSELKELKRLDNELLLSFYHTETERGFTHTTDAVILATGYHYCLPEFIRPLKEHIQWNSEKQYSVNRNYSIDVRNSIFVQNAELHSHGFNSPDLGMGPYRNSIILNTILGYEHYLMESQIAFQKFDVPPPPAL